MNLAHEKTKKLSYFTKKKKGDQSIYSHDVYVLNFEREYVFMGIRIFILFYFLK